MSNYPPEVEARIKVLDEYKTIDTLRYFNIFHLYPKELAYPDGYWDCRFFELVGFNTDTMEKKFFTGLKDGIDFWDGCIISDALVFADGAYFIKLAHFVEAVGDTQMLCVRPVGGAL